MVVEIKSKKAERKNFFRTMMKLIKGFIG